MFSAFALRFIHSPVSIAFKLPDRRCVVLHKIHCVSYKILQIDLFASPLKRQVTCFSLAAFHSWAIACWFRTEDGSRYVKSFSVRIFADWFHCVTFVETNYFNPESSCFLHWDTNWISTSTDLLLHCFCLPNYDIYHIISLECPDSFFILFSITVAYYSRRLSRINWKLWIKKRVSNLPYLTYE